jgi:diguanylate cyclase (GGDEF)-like protein/PAS domain S-box-containing protein
MTLNVVIVEDLSTDAELLAFLLREEGIDLQYQWVKSESGYRQALNTNPDLILCDWQLPQFNGQQALTLLHSLDKKIPFIVIADSLGKEASNDALSQGANACVIKSHPAHLGETVRGVMQEIRNKEHQQRQEKLRLAEQVFQNTAEGITVTDVAGNIVSVNPAFVNITGYNSREVIGQNPRFLKSGYHNQTFFKDMWSTLIKTGHWRGEIWNRRKNGDVYPEWLTISAVKDQKARTTHYVGVFSDLSQIKEAQEQINFLTYHDALTHLPNRTLFQERFQHALSHAKREHRSLALLYIDLDRFKTINENLGYPLGDQLLLEVSKRMGQVIRASDTLARLGGDEFILLLEEGASATHAVVVARKLINLFLQPMVIGEHELDISTSIGITLYPNDGVDPENLIRHAGQAMYKAKQYGGNHYRFFTKAFMKNAFEQLMMESDLHRAIERDELVLHFQPQVDLTDHKLHGLEALIRWQHPKQGLILPKQFIGLAEAIGMIEDLGVWVLRTACRQIVTWDHKAFYVPRISVNLSVHQIDRHDFIQRVANVLSDTGLPAERLELEVTESLLMRDPDLSRAILSELKILGINFAIDDFGSGYSSLAYLKLLPLDRLKIGRDFVRKIGRESDDGAIARAIIALAKSLGLETVAEGVEDEYQAAFMQQAGSNLVQGYLYGRPLPANEIYQTWAQGD